MNFLAHALSLGRGTEPVIQNVDLELRGGELVALLGANGSGKSTLLRALAGLDPVFSGQVPEASLLPAAQRRQHLAYLPQQPPRAPGYSIEDMVLMAAAGPLNWRASSSSKQRVREALEATDLSPLANRPCDQISGGEYRRALLAATLAQGAPVLLLDEPCAGLDLPHAAQVLEHLQGWLQQDADRAALVALHDLNLASLFCHRVLLLGQGGLLSEGSPEVVLQPDQLQQAFGAGLDCFQHPQTGQRVILPTAAT